MGNGQMAFKIASLTLEGSIFARALSSELHHDKDNLQKQLELVTLRLPAPKVSF
jgi:hypothetical protein